MRTSRLEAFSDGVLAIIITIMVLELQVPEEPTLEALRGSAAGFVTYLLSFIYVGIYWNNHHHMFQVVERVDGAVLWANLHLLFWLSLVPFASAWLGENYFSPVPVALYGAVLLMLGFAYMILAHLLVRQEGQESVIAKAIGKDRKALLSMISYVVAIVLAPFLAPVSLAIYFAVALSWFIPDPRIERAMSS